MLKKRIIPCLDVKEGRTVKGTNFLHLRDAGDPVDLARRYVTQGADELVFLDISASVEKRQANKTLTKRIARQVNIPFTIGGGIKSLGDASEILGAGADKITLNTAALLNPDLIDEIAGELGSQFIVLAVDVRKTANGYRVYSHGGMKETPYNALAWIKEAESRGCGEILLTSMDGDGIGNGYDLAITAIVSQLINIPVIASGGAGNLQHFAEAFTTGKADAALAASLFHFERLSIPQLKDFLKQKQIPIR